MENREPVVLAIDPSQRYLGYAYRSVYNKPIRIGSIEQKTDHTINWHIRAMLMASELTRLVEMNYEADGMRPIVVVIEVPDNWHTERGSDSKNSEAVQKLYFTAGAIIGMLRTLPAVSSIWCVLPKQWKGQTPKQVMMRRFAQLMRQHNQAVDLKAVPDDAAEAALLAHLSYAKQSLTDDIDRAYFESPYVCLYDSVETAEGSFVLETYVESDDPKTDLSDVRGCEDSSSNEDENADEDKDLSSEDG